MKKTAEEIRALLMKRFEGTIFAVFPHDDTELLNLLPENQEMICRQLTLIVGDKSMDMANRCWAAHYMIEYFADPLVMKTFFFKLFDATLLPRSMRLKPLVAQILAAVKAEAEEEALELKEKEVEPVDLLLECIENLGNWSPECLKRWAWDVEGEKLICSVSNKKLF